MVGTPSTEDPPGDDAKKRANVSEKPDDLQAVRTLVETLEKFDSSTQERIIRWGREKLGLIEVPSAPSAGRVPSTGSPAAATAPAGAAQRHGSTDIKSFVDSKNPSSDIEVVATVAYYYRFEAPQADRKESVTSQDCQEACRLTNRNRLNNPSKTLNNAHRRGLLDRTGEGAYSISTVGENLVAVALPAAGSSGRAPTAARRKTSSKKPTAKKLAGKKAAKKGTK